MESTMRATLEREGAAPQTAGRKSSAFWEEVNEVISVEFRSVGPGACHWCRKEKDEVYTVAFSDKSFVGPMCKADLLRAIGMKVGLPEQKPVVPPAVLARNGNP
jgi:hypothetical protein